VYAMVRGWSKDVFCSGSPLKKERESGGADKLEKSSCFSMLSCSAKKKKRFDREPSNEKWVIEDLEKSSGFWAEKSIGQRADVTTYSASVQIALHEWSKRILLVYDLFFTLLSL
jgi:hypothetical protein